MSSLEFPLPQSLLFKLGLTLGCTRSIVHEAQQAGESQAEQSEANKGNHFLGNIPVPLGLRWPTLNAAAADLAPSVVKRPAVGLVQGLHHLAPDGGHGMQVLVPARSPRTALPSSCLGPHLHLCDDLDRCICSAVVYGSTLQ